MTDTAPPAPGPVVCKPLGTLPLKDVPGFPPKAAADLAEVFGVVTLLDLEPFVNNAPAGSIPPAGPIRWAFESLNLTGADLDQATWTLVRQLTARFDPPPAPAAAEKPEKPKRTRKPKAASQDPAAPPARAEIPTPDLDNALRAILRWDLIDPCTDDEILAALEREWATPVEGRHPPGSDPTRGVMWSARVHPTLRRAEFRYGCGPDESPTPTLTGQALVAAVRRAFAIPKPGEVAAPPAGPGCPELSGIVRVNAVSAAPEPEEEAPPARAKCPACGDTGTVPLGPGGTDAPCVSCPLPPPARADDFDEATPPPRRRPQGEPVTGFVTLGPAESLVGTFWNWDQQGRVPLGSLLAEGVRELGQFRGWRLAAPPYTHKPDGLPAAGEMLPAGLAAGYEPRAVVQVKGEKGRYTVLSPREGT